LYTQTVLPDDEVFCIYREVSPDEEQKTCSKHVEVNYLKYIESK